MTDLKTFTETAQTQSLNVLRQSQETFAHAANAWAESIQQVVDSRRRTGYSDRLPQPQDVIDTVFDVADGVLSAQRQVTHSLLNAANPAFRAAADATVNVAEATNGNLRAAETAATSSAAATKDTLRAADKAADKSAAASKSTARSADKAAS